MSIFDLTTEQTLWVPQWRADGRFVLFGEGERHRCAWPARSCDDPLCTPDNPYTRVPPTAMTEAAQPCQYCDGRGRCVGGRKRRGENPTSWTCDHCSNGQRRHPVTVPCDGLGGEHRQGPCPNDGRISTGLLAVVEFGPAIVVRDMEDVGSAYWGPACVEINPENGWTRRWPAWDGALDYDDGEDITLPPDVDPASLVGQWAIGGRIEVAG